jgi:uncharacterized protein YlxP (DUF503 family)
MVLGLLQFELLVPGAESLKDKRRVVQSVKDRLHREHLVSVAEVGALESHTRAMLALALVGADGRHVGEVFDGIAVKLRALHDAELGDTRRDIFTSGAIDAMREEAESPGGDALRAEMLARAGEADHTRGTP